VVREVLSGVIGGVVGAGLMKVRPPPPAITSQKATIAPQSLAGGASVTLLPATTYKFAIIMFHGDGATEVRVDVTVDATTTSIYGNEQAIELVAGQSVSISATNTGTATASTPTIEIAFLNW